MYDEYEIYEGVGALPRVKGDGPIDDVATTTFGPVEYYASPDSALAKSSADHAKSLAPRKGAFMQTYTGRQFWPMDPRPEEVDINDIAHSLSMQCRYAGHCDRFYSVAEHSVLLAEWVNQYDSDAASWALLHDASEAYLVDVPRPVKPFLTGYKAAESKVMAAICNRFNLPLRMPEIVHEADNRIIADELVNLVHMDWHRQHNDPLGVTLRYWSPDMANEKFIQAYYKYSGWR